MWTKGFLGYVTGQSFATRDEWIAALSHQLAIAEKYSRGPARKNEMSSVQDKVYIAEQWPAKAKPVLFWLHSRATGDNLNEDAEAAILHITGCLRDQLDHVKAP